MNILIDELQEYKFIKPIFEAMKAHVDDATFIKIYFDVNLPEYAQYVPDRIMADPQFIKEAIKRNLLDYSRVPEKFKNTDFITKEDYLILVENGRVTLNNKLYSQDKDIVLKGIKWGVNKEAIEPQFRDDVHFMAQCIKLDDRAWHYFDKQSELLANKELVVDILVHNKNFFYKIPESDRQEKYILKAMLTDRNGYKILNREEILKKITDPELVLEA